MKNTLSALILVIALFAVSNAQEVNLYKSLVSNPQITAYEPFAQANQIKTTGIEKGDLLIKVKDKDASNHLGDAAISLVVFYPIKMMVGDAPYAKSFYKNADNINFEFANGSLEFVGSCNVNVSDISSAKYYDILKNCKTNKTFKVNLANYQQIALVKHNEQQQRIKDKDLIQRIGESRYDEIQNYLKKNPSKEYLRQTFYTSKIQKGMNKKEVGFSWGEPSIKNESSTGLDTWGYHRGSTYDFKYQYVHFQNGIVFGWDSIE